MNMTQEEHSGRSGSNKFWQCTLNCSNYNWQHKFDVTSTNEQGIKESMTVTAGDPYGWVDSPNSIYIDIAPEGDNQKRILVVVDPEVVPTEKISFPLDDLIQNVQRLSQTAPWNEMTIGDIWPVNIAEEKANHVNGNSKSPPPSLGLGTTRTLCNILAANTNTLSVIVPDGDQSKSLGQSQLWHCIQDLRLKLAKLNLPTSSTIMLVLGNSLDYVVAFLAVIWSRYVAAPINSALKEQENDFYVKDIAAGLVLVPKGGYDAGSAAISSAKKNGITVAECYLGDSNVMFHVKGGSDQTDGNYLHTDLLDAREDDVALTLHTSGTTGRPKAVPLTHKNLYTSPDNVNRTYKLTSDDRTVLIMPLYHIHGIVAPIFSPLLSGGTIILPARLTPDFWTFVKRYRATWYTATPTMHHVLLEFGVPKPDRSSKLRFIRSCSSALSPALFHQLEEEYGSPVLESCAMTEASHLIASNPLPPAKRLPGCVGMAQGVELQIRTANGDHVEPGAEGEVCIRGANVSTGYLNNEEANRASFFEDRFFRTGDQGKLDADGYLTLTGRLKEFINKGGEKISPVELDNIISAREDVDEVVCFAIEDDVYGQEVGAAIRPKKGIELDVSSVRHWIAQRVAAHEIPKKVGILDEIPKTATGKVQRKMVADKLTQTSSTLPE